MIFIATVATTVYPVPSICNRVHAQTTRPVRNAQFTKPLRLAKNVPALKSVPYIRIIEAYISISTNRHVNANNRFHNPNNSQCDTAVSVNWEFRSGKWERVWPPSLTSPDNDTLSQYNFTHTNYLDSNGDTGLSVHIPDGQRLSYYQTFLAMNDLPSLNASEIELLRQFEEELDSEKNRRMTHDVLTDPHETGIHITKVVARKYAPRNQDHIPASGTTVPPLESPGKYRIYNLSELFVPTDHMTRDRRSTEASGTDEYHRASSAPMLRLWFQKTEPSSEELSPSSLDEIYLRPDQVKFLRSQIDKYFLIGYDCSKPREVSAVSSFIPCEQRLGEREEVGVVQTSTYQILQYEDERTLTATRCTRWKSQSTFFCGNAHHATPFPSMSYNERVTPLTGAECQTLATLGKYVDIYRRTHTIAQNQEYTLSYYTHGSTSPYSDWTGTQIICNGHRFLERKMPNFRSYQEGRH